MSATFGPGTMIKAAEAATKARYSSTDTATSSLGCSSLTGR